MRIDRRVAVCMELLTAAMVLGASLGCALERQSARASGETASKAAPQRQAKVPLALRGIWYADDAEGRAACESYLQTDVMTIERTGSDPLVGAVVATLQIIHRYSEYGEGDFFRVDHADKQPDGAWLLIGQVFVDTRPDDSVRGSKYAERFEIASDGLSFSSSETSGQSFFRCGDVRSDLYSVP